MNLEQLRKDFDAGVLISKYQVGELLAYAESLAAPIASRILTHQNICVVGRGADGSDHDLQIFGDGAKGGKYLVLVGLPEISDEEARANL